MINQQHHSSLLSERETAVLNLIRHGKYSFQELGQIFSTSPQATRKLVSSARLHFAEIHSLSPESLDLAASKGKHIPRITKDEAKLLNIYFDNLFKNARPPVATGQSQGQSASSPPIPEEHHARLDSEGKMPSGQWADHVMQERQALGKRQR